jgi:hypothetical protein
VWPPADWSFYVCLSAGVASKENFWRGLEKDVHVRYEVITAVTMKNAVFWDIRT